MIIAVSPLRRHWRSAITMSLSSQLNFEDKMKFGLFSDYRPFQTGEIWARLASASRDKV